MRLNYDVRSEDVRRYSYKTTKLISILDEFAQSEKELVEVQWGKDEYKNVKSASGVLYQTIKRSNAYPSIHVMTRRGRLYLIKIKIEV